MKDLTIIFAKDPEKDKDIYSIPDGMNGADWTKFKNDYHFILQRFIYNAKVKKVRGITIIISKLPVLSDDLNELKNFMSSEPTPTNIKLWNLKRDEAKDKFTATVISKLDASGYVSRHVKNLPKL